MRRSLAPLLLALLAGPALAARADDLAAVLRRAARDGAGPEAMATLVADELPAALPQAFEALALREIVDPDGHSAPLGPVERGALALALARAPRAPLLDHMRRVASDGLVAERKLGLVLIGASGTADDLALACALAVDREGRVDRALLRPLEQALADVVARDARGVETAARLLAETGPVVQTPLLRALGAAGGAPAVQELARLSERDSPLQLVALTELGRLLAAGEGLADPSVVRVARTLAAHPDPAIQREALLCLGRLGDDDSIPHLLNLLEGEHAGLRTNAWWALRELTGLPFGDDPRRWRTWYEAEQDWWNGPAQELLRGMRGGRRGDVVAALKAFSEHRLFRTELAAEVARLLGHPDDELVLLACYSLRQLGVPVDPAPLRRLLDHPDERVREAARATLAAVGGGAGPADAGDSPAGLPEAPAARPR